jgi:hypothetical protein
MADVVLFLHVLIVLFNVGAVPMIIIGGMRQWDWVRNRSFRLTHLGLMAFVVAETALGFVCPLTYLESALRGEGSGAEVALMVRLMRRLIYYDFPQWVFLTAYIAFIGLILFLYRVVPPRNRPNAMQQRGAERSSYSRK